MNETLRLLHTRKSDRSFTDEHVSDEHLEAIIEAGRKAPSSCNGQHVSVVVVRDPAKRARLAELAGNQAWVAKAPVFLAVVCDFYKLGKGVERAGSTIKVQDCIEGAIVSSLDTGIAMAHMAMAANALGLGTVPIGGIRNNPGDVIELLNLPPLTYVSVGLSIGHVHKPSSGPPPTTTNCSPSGKTRAEPTGNPGHAASPRVLTRWSAPCLGPCAPNRACLLKSSAAR